MYAHCCYFALLLEEEQRYCWTEKLCNSLPLYSGEIIPYIRRNYQHLFLKSNGLIKEVQCVTFTELVIPMDKKRQYLDYLQQDGLSFPILSKKYRKYHEYKPISQSNA